MIKFWICMILTIILLAVSAYAADPMAYVVNSVGETLSRINLRTHEIHNDILTLGSDVQSYPNQIIIRDSLAYVVNSGTNEIQVINLNTEQTIDYIPTGENSNPYWISFLDSQYVYVTLFLDNSLAKIDLISGSVVNVVSVGKRPEGVIIHDYKAYIACTGYNPDWSLDPLGKVVVYDILGDSVMKEITVGNNPQYLAADDSGRVHVVCTGNFFSTFGSVYIIDSATDEIDTSFEVGGSPSQIYIGADKVAYIPAAGFDFLPHVFTYNSLTLEIYHDINNPISVGGNVTMAIPTQDTTVLAGNFALDRIEEIDSTGNLINVFPVGDGPAHLDIRYLPGDFNGDYEIDISDIVGLIAWFYINGKIPRYPAWRANANGDFHYDISDIVFLINYLYGTRTPAPKVGPTWYLEH